MKKHVEMVLGSLTYIYIRNMANGKLNFPRKMKFVSRRHICEMEVNSHETHVFTRSPTKVGKLSDNCRAILSEKHGTLLQDCKRK